MEVRTSLTHKPGVDHITGRYMPIASPHLPTLICFMDTSQPVAGEPQGKSGNSSYISPELGKDSAKVTIIGSVVIKQEPEDPDWPPTSACTDRTPDAKEGGGRLNKVARQKLRERPNAGIAHNRNKGNQSFKTHICTKCNKPFKARSLLNMHMRIHRGEKPFHCEICGKCFGWKGDLGKHLLTHTGEKPYLCDVCHKAFRQKAALKVHQRTHTKERPYPCHLCGKSFIQQSHLSKHMVAHSGKKEYKCGLCGKAFATKYQLQDHNICMHIKPSLEKNQNIIGTKNMSQKGISAKQTDANKVEDKDKGQSMNKMEAKAEQTIDRCVNHNIDQQSMEIQENVAQIKFIPTVSKTSPKRYKEEIKGNKKNERGKSPRKQVKETIDYCKTQQKDKLEQVQETMNKSIKYVYNERSLPDTDIPSSKQATNRFQNEIKCKEKIKFRAKGLNTLIQKDIINDVESKLLKALLICNQKDKPKYKTLFVDMGLPVRERGTRNSPAEIDTCFSGIKEVNTSSENMSFRIKQNETEIQGNLVDLQEMVQPELDEKNIAHFEYLDGRRLINLIHSSSVEQGTENMEVFPKPTISRNNIEIKSHIPKIELVTNPKGSTPKNKREPQIAKVDEESTLHIPEKHMALKGNKCTICYKNLSTKAALQLHVKIHTGEKAFSCVTCGKAFVSKGELNKHLRTHTGDRPYFCTTCNKAFKQAGALQVHLNTHTRQNMFHCDICPKIFTQKCHLKKHVDMHNDTRNFKCTVCDAAFRTCAILRYHMNRHTGEKPYICSTCSQGFYDPSALKVHMRTHTGVKPYSCKECGKCFAQMENLKSHSYVHTGENPYKCNLCSMVFRYRKCLKRHKSNIHND